VSSEARDFVAAAMQSLQKGEPRSALNAASAGLKKFPDHAGLSALLGISNLQLGHLLPAQLLLKKALKLGPPTAPIVYHLGVIADQRGQADEARRHYEQASTLDDTHYPSLLNLANLLAANDEWSEAQALFRRAFSVSANPRIHKNLGVAALEHNDLESAQHHFKAALHAFPKWHDVELNLAFVLLKQGAFKEGWGLYEARFETEANRHIYSSSLQKWEFEPNRSVLIWTEQGVGDTIMYMSQLSEIADRCSTVGVVAEQRLHSLLRRSFGNRIHYYDRTLELPDQQDFDSQLSIESCPQFFRTNTESFNQSKRPYIKPDPHLVARFREQFTREAAGKPILGLSWRSKNTEVGLRRSIHFCDLLAVLPEGALHLVNLQYGDVSSELSEAREKQFTMSHPDEADYLADLEAFAATVAACDYVVTIDNSTAHFAGAMGKSQIILLPYVCDWRWGVKEEAIWYQDCVLMRQHSRGDWSEALASMANAVKSRLQVN